MMVKRDRAAGAQRALVGPECRLQPGWTCIAIYPRHCKITVDVLQVSETYPHIGHGRYRFGRRRAVAGSCDERPGTRACQGFRPHVLSVPYPVPDHGFMRPQRILLKG